MIWLIRFIKKILGEYNASKLARVFCYIPNIICSFLPMNDEILLESNPDLSCNTYELYRYFLQMGIHKKYKLTWRVRNPHLYTDNKPENVYYIEKYPSSISNKIKNYIRCNRAKISISCNANLPRYKTSRHQLNIYLDHGSQLKSMRTKDGMKAPLSCDYYTSQSKFFVPYHLQEYDINKEQIVCTGLPRDDQFFRENNTIIKIVPEFKKYKKIVIWAPTFREHRDGYRVDCHSNYPYGLPFVFSEDDINELKLCLEEENVLLLIKPHPAQNIEKLKMNNSEFIHVVMSEDLSRFNIQINELLAQTDALITDYSSIYYDYLFVKKPIALTLDDYNEYQDEKGFVFDDPLDVLVGEVLYSIDDLCSFIVNVSNEKDLFFEQREALQRKINDYNDGRSTERVYNFIMSEIAQR